MDLTQRHKQRVLTTIATTGVFLIGLILFFLLAPVASLETTLIVTFLVCIALLTAYQTYHYRYCHEHATLVNTLTQVYAGSILIAGILLMLLLKTLFAIEVVTSYLVLSVIVILLVFLTIGRYDEFLEDHVPRRLAAVQGKKQKKA